MAANPESGSKVPSSAAAGQQARRLWRKRVLWVVVACALVTLVWFAYRPQPVLVDLATVGHGAVESVIEEDARTRVQERFVVSAPVRGRMLRIPLQPGDPVEAGQALAKLLPVNAPLLDIRSLAEARARVAAARAQRQRALAALQQAEVQLSYAQKDAVRKAGLAERKAVSQRVLDASQLASETAQRELVAARQAVRVATHELGQAQAVLLGGEASADDTDDTGAVVVAPVAGTVLKVLQRSEGLVEAGTPLVELADPRALEVVVDVLSADAVQLHPDMAVRLLRWGGGAALAGLVTRIEPQAFTKVSALGIEEQRVAVVVALESDHGGWQGLGDGFQLDAELVLGRSPDSGLRVPAGALFRDGVGWATYVARDGVASQVAVQIGLRNADWVEVTSGLKAGQQVVVFPSERVADGVALQSR